MTQDSGTPTPRTDAAAILRDPPTPFNGQFVRVEFAHQLERELSSALDIISAQNNALSFEREQNEKLRRELSAARAQGMLPGLYRAQELLRSLWGAHDRVYVAQDVIANEIREAEQSTKNSPEGGKEAAAVSTQPMEEASPVLERRQFAAPSQERKPVAWIVVRGEQVYHFSVADGWTVEETATLPAQEQIADAVPQVSEQTQNVVHHAQMPETAHEPAESASPAMTEVEIALRYIWLDAKDRPEPFCQRIFSIADTALKKETP